MVAGKPVILIETFVLFIPSMGVISCFVLLSYLENSKRARGPCIKSISWKDLLHTLLELLLCSHRNLSD